MDPHDTFALPAAARVSLHKGGQLAVFDRLNKLSGKTEISFRNLRDFSPPDIALALHTHVRDHKIKNLRLVRLRKSIADRLLGIGAYRSGEASQFLVLKDSPLLKIAPPAECAAAGPGDAAEIERLCGVWASDDLFQPNRFNVFLMIDGKKAGFGSARHEKGQGEIDMLYLESAHQGKGHGKALMNELLKELSSRAYPRFSSHVESKNTKALKFFENYGFRWDNDLYFNLYG